MGVFKGQISYIRFYVDGGHPANWVEAYLRAIAMRRFVPLKPEGQDTESFGWVPVQTPFMDDVPITTNQILFGDSIVLALRRDQMALPRALLQDWLQKRFEEFTAKTGTEPKGETRHALEMAVITELRKKLLPRTRIAEMVWETKRNQIRFFARSAQLIDLFKSLFEQTFEKEISQNNFAEHALRTEMSLRAKGLLETLRPYPLFPVTERIEVAS